MHTTPLTVRFHELDAYGHVNHAVFLTYFETARIEALQAIGCDLAVLREQGLSLVIVALEVSYRQPATMGDELAISTAITELGGSSQQWRQVCTRAGRTVVEGTLRAATVGPDGRALRMPDDLRAALTQLMPAED